ncbi:hypothetical protein ONS95_009028 [Cadophora gregata]|uniref:uncharacterized protein n=1 Tax=Cadophora gregata TaxID=51156 RepID=UPI0026DD7260|nr:uncharacterized protein ONS95_009028 [Cadophora gregata]KAK0124043.1 hypothetical protein ONS95_009028 [Cadophora gregata]
MLQTMPNKLFIQMSGAPGSGKSTMAKKLGCSVNGVIIDHDILRSSFLEANTPFDEAAKHAYQLQWILAQDFMKQGHSIIIDSTCNYQEVLDQGSALAKQHGFTYWYVECKVQDIPLLDQRLRSRDSVKSQRAAVDCPPAAARSTRADQDSHALFQKWIDHPCRPQDNVIIVDATGNLDALRDDVLRQIMG